MNKKDEDEFDNLSWDAQLSSAKLASFMTKHGLDCLTMTIPDGYIFVLQKNKKVHKLEDDHGLDEKRIANGQ